MAETIGMIQKAVRDNAMSAVQIKHSTNASKDGQESFESDSHSGRSATSKTPENVECVQAAMNNW